MSVAAASKALSGALDVSAAVRERVIRAARELNFRPNAIAQGLKSGKSRTIGLLTDDLEGVFTTAMARGVEDVASDAGFNVFLCHTYKDLDVERRHLEVLLSKQVDGVILLSGYRVRHRGAPALPLGGLPVVYLYQYTSEIAVPCVIPDDVGGGRLATAHLLGLGRRRIALINGPEHFEAARQRREGYQEELTAAGLPVHPELITAGRWTQSSGYELAGRLLGRRPLPDAFFCASDSIAAGALDAVHERGLRVPGEIAVVGFDNRYMSQHLRPPLTTVALPLYEMGRLAGEMLLEAIGGAAAPAVTHSVPCRMVVRQSCGAAPDEP